MSKAANRAKQRWEGKTYRKYVLRLREDTDQELINYIETFKGRFGTTEIFRVALQQLIDNGGI